MWQALPPEPPEPPEPSLLVSSVFTADLLAVILGTFGMS